MSMTATVQQVYEAFGKGDVETIVGLVADGVSWDNSRVVSSACPWNGDFSGKANLPGFFAAVDESIDFSAGAFEPLLFVESGNAVAVQLHLESRVRKNGRMLVNDVIHLWTFDDAGRIASYKHFNDTAAELEAWRD
jgi:ketosteroid isomerase-like protein